MEMPMLRNLGLTGFKLLNASSKYFFSPHARTIHVSLLLNQAKLFDQKKHSTRLHRLHTPFEQHRYSSVLQQQLKLRPVECPDERTSDCIKIEGKLNNLKNVGPTLIHQQTNQTDLSKNENTKPLVVLIAWLGAKEKHIEKYSEIWTQRGFDVITEKIDALDLVFPKQRAIPRVRKLVDKIYELSLAGNNPDMVLHCFSVGGYIFGEMLHQLLNEQTRKEIQADNSVDPRTALQKSIKGIIFDSLVNIEGMSRGVSRSLTGNPLLSSLIRHSIDLHLRLSHNFATKYYETSSEYAHGNSLFNVPSLFFVSDADYIGTPAMTQRIASMWNDRGIPVQIKYFNGSEHVRHYTTYPDVYQAELDRFLCELPLQCEVNLGSMAHVVKEAAKELKSISKGPLKYA